MRLLPTTTNTMMALNDGRRRLPTGPLLLACAVAIANLVLIADPVTAAPADDEVACSLQAGDRSRVASVLLGVQRACSCELPRNEYLTCAEELIGRAATESWVRSSCLGEIREGVVNSICGLPAGATPCCVTDAAGAPSCQIAPSPAECVAPPGGAARMGSTGTCFNACEPGCGEDSSDDGKSALRSRAESVSKVALRDVATDVPSGDFHQLIARVAAEMQCWMPLDGWEDAETGALAAQTRRLSLAPCKLLFPVAECNVDPLPPSCQGPDQGKHCEGEYCDDIRYCGSGNSCDPGLACFGGGGKVPGSGTRGKVTQCLNNTCFKHDKCYGETCEHRCVCVFNGQGECEDPFFESCTSGCGTESVTNAMVCGIALGIRGLKEELPQPAQFYCDLPPCIIKLTKGDEDICKKCTCDENGNPPQTLRTASSLLDQPSPTEMSATTEASAATELGSQASSAETRICAVVKIEIKQELTLERQAFDAGMIINNGFSDRALSDVSVDVTVSDERGVPVTVSSDPNGDALFFLRVLSLDGISGIGGEGQLAQASKGEIHWLLIPAPGSGGVSAEGRRYFVGAVLRYRAGGEYHEVAVAPDFITVRPVPELDLDYFLTSEVRADDPFTPAIEEPESFTLGLRMRNSGAGDANQVRLDTAQPEIVENRQGLLIGFEILTGYVDDEVASPNLLLNFGALPAGKCRAGRWEMQTNLSGTFVDFKASVTHADELGGELTSLIRSTRTHFLIRDVRVDLPGRDHVRDFLARERTVGSGSAPLMVHESDCGDTAVTDQSDVATITATGTDEYVLTIPATAGFAYARILDPAAGQREIRRVTRRGDGKVLLSENAWLHVSGTGSETQHFLSLFDANGGGEYLVEMGAIDLGPRPPVLQFIPDRTTAEGSQIGFLVEASDPNGTVPSLSIAALPVGATFTDQGGGVGFFQWFPQRGQAGDYPVTFRASDGTLTARRSATIHVLGEGTAPTPTATPGVTESATPASTGRPATPSTTPTIAGPSPGPTTTIPHLAGEPAKRADKCQAEIKKASVKFVGNKLKRLAGCAKAVLTCVETKPGNTKCLEKATRTCSKSVAKVADDEELLLDTIQSKCAAVSSADLLSAAGLGYERLVQACQDRFEIAVTDVKTLASCVMTHHECVTERLFETQNPRAAELFRLAGVSLGSDACLQDSGAAGNHVGDDAVGKAVGKCSAEIADAGGAFATKRLKSLEKCVDAYFSCVQTKPGNQACTSQAGDVCDEEQEKIDDEGNDLDDDIEKSCASVPFATLRAPDAVSFLSLGARCEALGVRDLGSLADYRECLARQSACATEELIRFAAPRAEELLQAFGRDFGAESCAP